MSEKKLAIKNSYDITSAQSLIQLAQTLRQHIVEYKLYSTINQKNYVHVEGWQFAGALLGLKPVVCDLIRINDKDNEVKYSCKVEIRNREGQVVGVGIAICSNKENKKKTFDEYAIASMAQTRAIGKGYRNIIGWVINMSGYEATPSEEMATQAENDTNRENKVGEILNLIKSIRTNEALENLKTNLNKERSKMSKEDKAKIKKALDEKESELSLPNS